MVSVAQGSKPLPRLMFSLRKVNRVLRWTGWRLAVEFNKDYITSSTQNTKPNTKVGLVWYGWGFINHLKEDLNDN